MSRLVLLTVSIIEKGCVPSCTVCYLFLPVASVFSICDVLYIEVVSLYELICDNDKRVYITLTDLTQSYSTPSDELGRYTRHVVTFALSLLCAT